MLKLNEHADVRVPHLLALLALNFEGSLRRVDSKGAVRLLPGPGAFPSALAHVHPRIVIPNAVRNPSWHFGLLRARSGHILLPNP